MKPITQKSKNQLILAALEKINQEELGRYLLQKLEEDRNINEVKRPLLSDIEYYGTDDVMTQIEYIALLLMRKYQ